MNVIRALFPFWTDPFCRCGEHVGIDDAEVDEPGIVRHRWCAK